LSAKSYFTIVAAAGYLDCLLEKKGKIHIKKLNEKGMCFGKAYFG